MQNPIFCGNVFFAASATDYLVCWLPTAAIHFSRPTFFNLFFKAVKKKKEENQLLSGNKSGPSVSREMADPVTGEGRAPPGDLPPSVPDNFMSGHPDANVLSLV